MANEEKTNVMRILDGKKIKYKAHTYPFGEVAPSGEEVAAMLGEDPDTVYKTLVTQGSRSGKYFIFVIPVRCELDLKAAAAAVGEKAVSMIRSKELLPLTGYVHGGCSPIGMKKQFQTVVDESARELENIIFSGGKIGYQVEMSPRDLERVIPLSYGSIATPKEE